MERKEGEGNLIQKQMHHQVVHCNSQVLICLQFIPLQGNRDNIASYQSIPVFKLALHSQTQSHPAAANTISISPPVYYFVGRFSMSHQAALMARFRGTGIWLRTHAPTLIDLHTKTSTRNFSGHRYIHRSSDIWVLALVEPTQALPGTACEAKNSCGGKQIPQGLQMAGAVSPRELAETAWLALGRVGWLHQSLQHVFCLLQIPGNAQNSSLSIPLACIVGNKTFTRSPGITLMSGQSKQGERVAANPSKFSPGRAWLFSWWTKHPHSQGVTCPSVKRTGTWWEQSLMPMAHSKGNQPR